MMTVSSVFTSWESALYACQNVMVPLRAVLLLAGVAASPHAASAIEVATAKAAVASSRRRVSTLLTELVLLRVRMGAAGGPAVWCPVRPLPHRGASARLRSGRGTGTESPRPPPPGPTCGP